jgi:transcriptional regulator with XRE-family HTH domain
MVRENLTTIGTIIGRARKQRKWSLRELERRSGVHNSIISQIESGHIKDPSFRKVVRLARALDLRLYPLADEM